MNSCAIASPRLIPSLPLLFHVILARDVTEVRGAVVRVIGVGTMMDLEVAALVRRWISEECPRDEEVNIERLALPLEGEIDGRIAVLVRLQLEHPPWLRPRAAGHPHHAAVRAHEVCALVSEAREPALGIVLV